MQLRHETVAVLASAVVLAGCASKPQVGQINPRNRQDNTTWNGTLSTPSGMSGATDLRGTASLAGNGVGNSIAMISITNAAPKGVHPWAIYRGQCGNDGDVVGVISAYPPLVVDNDGAASASAKLQVPLPVAGDFHANVEASPSNMETVIACGNLASPSGQ